MYRLCRAWFVASGCVAVCAALVVACGEVTFQAQWNMPLPIVRESAAGIYVGSFTDTSGAHPVAVGVTAIVDENNDASVIFALDAERHYAGHLFVMGTRLEGTLTEYNGAVARFVGTDGVGEILLDGTVVTADSLVGSYSAATHAGRFALDYQESWERNSSLDRVTGVWTFSMAASNGVLYTVTWDIDEQGRAFGTDTLGCVFDGQFSIIDQRYNAYDLAINVTSCGNLNAQYRGHAFLQGTGAPDLDRLMVSVSNPAYAFVTALHR